MMSIPTSTAAPAPQAPVDPAAASAASAPAAEGAGPAAGFVALIDALLQGAGLPAASVPTLAAPAPAAAPGDVPVSTTDDASDAATIDLLAALGLTSAVADPPPAATMAPVEASSSKSKSPKEDTDAAAEADAAAPLAAAAVLALAGAARPSGDPAAQTASPGTGAAARDASASQAAIASATQSAQPVVVPTTGATPAQTPPLAARSVKADADAPPSGDDAKSIESLLDAGAIDRGVDAQGANGADGAGSGQGGLNAWAAAAHRIAGGQDGAPRPAAGADGSLRETVGTPRWKDELAARITLMSVQGQQSGSLRLSPEHLGPLEIQITVADDKTTNVQFGAQHAETRTALQEALPRLREMFAGAGLQLGDAGVSGQAPRQRPTEDTRFATGGLDGRGDGEPTPLPGPVRSITHSGLLDTYA